MRSHVYNNPASDPEAEPFLKAIADAPGDQLHRQIFADWLQENGYENAAMGQRWAAKYNKFPAKSGYRGGQVGWSVGGQHNTHTGLEPELNEPHANRTLPQHFFSHDTSTGSWLQSQLWHAEASKKEPHLPERSYLNATHLMNWNPETGEPIDSKEESK